MLARAIVMPAIRLASVPRTLEQKYLVTQAKVLSDEMSAVNQLLKKTTIMLARDL